MVFHFQICPQTTSFTGCCQYCETNAYEHGVVKLPFIWVRISLWELCGSGCPLFCTRNLHVVIQEAQCWGWLHGDIRVYHYAWLWMQVYFRQVAIQVSFSLYWSWLLILGIIFKTLVNISLCIDIFFLELKDGVQGLTNACQFTTTSYQGLATLGKCSRTEAASNLAILESLIVPGI